MVVMVGIGWIAVFPAAVCAEGSVRWLDCAVARVCDGAGSCAADSSRVVFRMQPVDAEADGGGRYALSYEDAAVEMQALSDVGPFFWTAAAERHTLLASSQTEFLWHRLIVDPSPRATIRFLTCTFGQ